jgi:hypothetical protein
VDDAGGEPGWHALTLIHRRTLSGSCMGGVGKR